MAADGSQLPAWTGQAFSYLMHHPASSAGTAARLRMMPSSSKHANCNLALLALLALLVHAERPATVATSGDVAPAHGVQVLNISSYVVHTDVLVRGRCRICEQFPDGDSAATAGRHWRMERPCAPRPGKGTLHGYCRSQSLHVWISRSVIFSACCPTTGSAESSCSKHVYAAAERGWRCWRRGSRTGGACAGT